MKVKALTTTFVVGQDRYCKGECFDLTDDLASEAIRLGCACAVEEDHKPVESVEAEVKSKRPKKAK